MATSWTNISKNTTSWTAGSMNAGFLLNEGGGVLNLESGSVILLEQVGTFAAQYRNTTRWTNQAKS